MKNRETKPSGRWAHHRLWYPGGKTGESIVPLGLQNITIKKGEGLRRNKENLKTGEPSIKFCQGEKTQRKLVKLFPGILKKATIAHTWIKKESNFASFKG